MSQKDIGNKIPIYKLKAGKEVEDYYDEWTIDCLLYTSPSPRDRQKSRMPSSA